MCPFANANYNIRLIFNTVFNQNFFTNLGFWVPTPPPSSIFHTFPPSAWCFFGQTHRVAMESKRIDSLPFHTKPCPSGSGCVEINSASMIRGNSWRRRWRLTPLESVAGSLIIRGYRIACLQPQDISAKYWGIKFWSTWMCPPLIGNINPPHILWKNRRGTTRTSMWRISNSPKNLQTSPVWHCLTLFANEQQSGHTIAQAAPCYQSKPCRDQSRPENKGLLAPIPIENSSRYQQMDTNGMQII